MIWNAIRDYSLMPFNKQSALRFFQENSFLIQALEGRGRPQRSLTKTKEISLDWKMISGVSSFVGVFSSKNKRKLQLDVTQINCKGRRKQTQ